MKRLFTILAALCSAAALSAQPGAFIPGYDKEIDDEPVELYPSYVTVHSGRELPRSFTVPYPDEQSALAGSLAPSLYLQPMDEPPTVQDTGTHTEYTWKYKVPFAWVGRMVSVFVGSADNPYTVLANGHEAGSNQSARTAAEFDLTALSNEGVNTLTVQVEKNPAASAITGNPGAGKITGKVLVMSQPRIRVRDYVYRVNLAADEPTLELGIILKTHMLNPRGVTLHFALRDREGTTVASGHREAQVGRKEEDTVRFFLTVKDLKPWSFETPHTYDLLIKNQYEGRYTEYVNYRTGFRNIYMHQGRLYTNGYPLLLSFHVMDGIPAAGESAAYLAGVKEKGYNIVSVPYPPGEEFYRAADSLGIYICNQADVDTSAGGGTVTVGGNPSNDPRWAESFADRALAMYGTSAIHPSVAMFSIARNSANGYNLYESYLALKSREKFRPVIYPDGGGQWNSDAVSARFALDHPEAVRDRIVLAPLNPEQIYTGNSYTRLEYSASGTFTVSNNSRVTRLRGQVVYTFKKGKKAVAAGTVPVDIDPGEIMSGQIPVPEEFAGKKIKLEAELNSNFD